MAHDGYSITMREDTRTGEHLAFIPNAYRANNGARYYMAYSLADGWIELSPEYATRNTRTITNYSHNLKRAVDRNLGHILNLRPRLYG